MFHFICRRLSHLRASPGISSPCKTTLVSCSVSSLAAAPVSVPNTSNQQHSFTVSYLINSCGFPPQRAISVSKHIKFKTPNRGDSVLAFFENHGFTETQVRDFITKHPNLLTCNPQKNFLPKLEFFSSIGLSSMDRAKLLLTEPIIMGRSLENQIIPSFNFFKSLLQSDEKTISVIKRCPRVLSCNLQASFVHNIRILREIGVPESNIVVLVYQHPSVCARISDKFRSIVMEVEKMGFIPSRMTFLSAIRALNQMSKSTWEKKMELYKKWGLSEDEIIMAFGKQPCCMMASEDKITRVMDFLVNEMGCETSIIVKNPTLIGLSFEKRIVPRCLVYQYLEDKGLMKKEKVISLLGWLKCTEIAFLNKIRKSYEGEAPELLKLCQEKLDLAK